MALTNRITGESLEQEIQHNRQVAQTEEPMLSEQPNETPASPKPRRKKSSESDKLPQHTSLYLMEQAEGQLRRLSELGDRMESILKDVQNAPIPKSATEGADCERTLDELVAELGHRFDDQCKRIVGQHLSDAAKESERLCRQLSRAGKQAVGHRCLLIGTLVTSIASLLTSAVTIILLLTQ